jgi:hypothetical protein
LVSSLVEFIKTQSEHLIYDLDLTLTISKETDEIYRKYKNNQSYFPWWDKPKKNVKTKPIPSYAANIDDFVKERKDDMFF